MFMYQKHVLEYSRDF